jgi:branched-chain amino acid transport system permease protein/neutral amino acid transport system permease protein
MNRDLLVVLLAVVVATAGLSRVYGGSVIQFLMNGLVVGSIYVLGATGLSLVFGIRKFANFAHGEMMTFGAYMAYLANVYWFLDILWGLVFAVVATAIVGMLLELLVFRKLAARGPVPALVASIGITIFLSNLVELSFGTSFLQYNLRISLNWVLLSEGGAPILAMNPVKGVATLAVSTTLIVLLHIMLRYTTLGRAMRATADNMDLARASGVNVRNVILWTWAIAGALAAIAGVLLGIGNDVRPALGFNVLLFVFAAVIIGGLGSPYGAMLGGLVVGIAQELSVPLLVWFGRPDVASLPNPTAYSPVAAFLIMILVLLLRPGGLAHGKGTVLRTHAGLRLRNIFIKGGG